MTQTGILKIYKRGGANMHQAINGYYMTRAVADELSGEHQQFILRYLVEQALQLTDYLQVFEFYVENDEQWLRQRQEVPHRETIVEVNLYKAKQIERTVWSIVDDQYVIILFPEDY